MGFKPPTRHWDLPDISSPSLIPLRASVHSPLTAAANYAAPSLVVQIDSSTLPLLADSNCRISTHFLQFCSVLGSFSELPWYIPVPYSLAPLCLPSDIHYGAPFCSDRGRLVRLRTRPPSAVSRAALVRKTCSVVSSHCLLDVRTWHWACTQKSDFPSPASPIAPAAPCNSADSWLQTFSWFLQHGTFRRGLILQYPVLLSSLPAASSSSCFLL